MFEGEQDSLSKTKEFTDYVIRNYTQNLYNKNIPFYNTFVDASKYYSMTDARGFNADLARYCYYLPQVLDSKQLAKPLIEDKNLSDLYDKYVAEYQATVAANKQGLADNIHYLDMTEVAPENTLQTILDRYKGKTILIDIWATWCGPCKFGHEKMKTLKEELSDKDIVYVYLTSPTSNYEEWKKYIADISGEHYFLTQEQLDGIFQQLNKNSYPTYAVFSPDGEKIATLGGFRNVEVIRDALEKAFNK
jgi:thiol-disulfide isomerase/thioredoxin